ncbi:MAG: formylglycine-generating enzyme family protein, partial [Polyangiaceae bacterium]|nr:formylglycine-generating enzyme family protein [Polyangiaceae bacterium]
ASGACDVLDCAGQDGAEGAPGSNGAPGADGSPGADGDDSLVLTSDVAPGTLCTSGGQRIDVGVDADGSGTLDAGEITSTEYVCNGVDGSPGADGTDGLNALIAVSVEPAGSNCIYGGQKIETGLDADRDGVLDAGEVDTAATTYVCEARPQEAPAGVACASGATDGCGSHYVPGGSYCRGGDCSTTATVSGFYLDTYEVTVARFRRFVEAYDGTPPTAGDGAHPLIAGSGWDSAWDGYMPSQELLTGTLLHHCGSNGTWTDDVGINEAKPINCVTWYWAFAFCAWDGGRLATEAEWEYAAGGGNENRTYPWGNTNPASDCTLANWADCEPDQARNVGSSPAGAARWGHQDLAGNLYEWTLDYYRYAAPYPASCSNCANLTDSEGFNSRVMRGGDYLEGTATTLYAAFRDFAVSDLASRAIGFRCARTP